MEMSDKRAVQLISYDGAVRYRDWIIRLHKTNSRWTVIAHQKLTQSKPILYRKVIDFIVITTMVQTHITLMLNEFPIVNQGCPTVR